MSLQKYTVSFEVFPPKTEAGSASLFSELAKLSTLSPDFISVTYGAGGSTRDKTLEIAQKIKNGGTDVLVHFTCVGSSRGEIAEYLTKVRDAGFTQLLALRGDPPRDVKDFVPHPDGFAYANELVAFIKARGDFSISVAGYPEGHPAAPSIDFDIDMLKKKVDAGAERVITQLFFDNNDFEHFLDKCRKKGITVPVVPGIMPIKNSAQLERVVSLSNAKIPGELRGHLAAAAPDAFCEASLEFAARQIEGLRKMGIEAFHLYPLNRAEGIKEVLQGGGIR